jgi:transposase InsO family protein
MKIHETQHALTDLCAAFGVSRSGYHAWKTRPPSARQRADETLSQTLCQAHAASRQTYGSPRLLAALRQQGHHTSRRRVRRLMRQQALHTVVPRRFVPQTTDSRHDQPIAPNRLAQGPAPTGPNQVWVGDITYVQTQEGWLYVAAVLDRWSRRVIGLAMDGHMESTLVGAALHQALHQRQPAAGCVHHTDRGSQYASAAYREQVGAAGLLASMSRAGNCYDNAAMESFWSRLKTELVHRRDFASREQARRAIFEYVEVFYNRTRLHSALGYKSPVDFENQLN